jgi:hypothetical protein
MGAQIFSQEHRMRIGGLGECWRAQDFDFGVYYSLEEWPTK